MAEFVHRKLEEAIPWFEQLERIEGADPQFLDRRGIEKAQGAEGDQQRKAGEPRIAELTREPPPQYP